MGLLDKKKEIVEVSLKTFMEKGLADTTTRDLCKALKMTPSHIFYYFSTKDDIIIACIDEAKERIEKDLFGIALQDLDYPEKLANDLYGRATKMRPLMKFFVSACTMEKYADAVQPSLDRLSLRYKSYTELFAERLLCKPEDVAPYVYTTINTMLSYMLFGKTNFVAPQLQLVYRALCDMLKERDSIKAAAGADSGKNA